LIFSLKESALKASVIPRMASYFEDVKLALKMAMAFSSDLDSEFQAYGRALGNLGPGRGLSSTENNEVSFTGSSRTAGNTQSGEHCV
jgi:4'-phosphopantetheinyl transferase EntD